MAIIRGKPGRYTSEETARLQKRRLMMGVAMIGTVCFAEGVTLSTLWAKLNLPGVLTTLVQLGGLTAICVMVRWGLRRMDELEADRIKWQKGDEGETVVGKILATLPDEYHVINDIKVPGQKANLDHVVVGPTGVFVLDAKNNRGLIEADGKGELLVNRNPARDINIRAFVARYMEVRKRVCVFASGTDPYLQGLLVFTSAWVDAPWGQTGKVNCLHEGRLKEYLEDDPYGDPISPEDVKKIADAFWKLAQMDPDFTDKATEAITPKPTETELTKPATDRGELLPNAIRVRPPHAYGRTRSLD